jgi:hypothetical protein
MREKHVAMHSYVFKINSLNWGKQGTLNERTYLQIKEIVVLDGIVVRVLAIGPKVHVFIPNRGR